VVARRVYAVEPFTLAGAVPWAADSRHLAASSYYRSGGYVIDVKTGNKRFLPSDARFDRSAFSPDSSRLIFESSEMLSLTSLRTKRTQEIAPGSWPAWGKRGVALARRANVYLKPSPGKRARRLLSASAGRSLVPVSWSANGRRLLIINRAGDDLGAIIFDLPSGTAIPLPGDFTAVDGISRDGKSVLAETGGDIVAVADDGATHVLAQGAAAATWDR
jgi:hypothetical protein